MHPINYYRIDDSDICFSYLCLNLLVLLFAMFITRFRTTLFSVVKLLRTQQLCYLRNGLTKNFP